LSQNLEYDFLYTEMKTKPELTPLFVSLVLLFAASALAETAPIKLDVDVDLRVGIGHEPKMPLLTELENLFCSGFYNYFAPTVLQATRRQFQR